MAGAKHGGVEEAEELAPPTTELLNMRCTGVRRLLKEAIELREPNELFCAKPMEDNLFEWHFTVRGPPDSVYADGVYHGRIVLPADYPMKPPNLILLTPNGRFETNKKICLSISGYHPETWLPSWSIRTALLALIGFMTTHSAGALGGLECSSEERRRLAIRSRDWHCATCALTMRDVLPELGSTGRTERLLEEVQSATTSPKKTPSADAAADQTGATPTNTTAVASESRANGEVNNTNVVSRAQQQLANDLSGGGRETTNARQSSIAVVGPSSSPLLLRRILENPLFWIGLLTAVLCALLLRRVLLEREHYIP